MSAHVYPYQLSQVQSEHVVGKHPSVVGIHQLEHLTELEGIRLSLREKLASRKHHDTIIWRRLAVNSGEAELYLSEGESGQVLSNSLLPNESPPFPCQNGLLLVQTAQYIPVCFEGVVVVVCKLLTDRVRLFCVHAEHSEHLHNTRRAQTSAYK